MSLEIVLGYTATIISLVVAVFSTIVSYRSLKIADKSAQATIETVEIFNQEIEDNAVAKNMEFHYSITQMFRELQLKFPPEMGDPNFKPTKEVNRLIFVFWFLIFDEWFACNHEGKYLSHFWEAYYEKEVYSVLKRDMFADVIKSMVDEKGISFFGLSEPFSAMLNKIYFEIHNKNLFKRFDEKK